MSGRIDLKSVRLKTAQKYSNWLLFYLFFQKQAPFSVPSKESSPFLTKPLFPQGREDVTALWCSEPLRSKVGGPSKVYAMVVRDGTALLRCIPYLTLSLIYMNQQKKRLVVYYCLLIINFDANSKSFQCFFYLLFYFNRSKIIHIR